jgi:hypothetical protein
LQDTPGPYAGRQRIGSRRPSKKHKSLSSRKLPAPVIQNIVKRRCKKKYCAISPLDVKLPAYTLPSIVVPNAGITASITVPRLRRTIDSEVTAEHEGALAQGTNLENRLCFRIEQDDGLDFIDADYCQRDGLYDRGQLRFAQFLRMHTGWFLRFRKSQRHPYVTSNR